MIKKKKYALIIAFLVACIATFISLYSTELQNITPTSLEWFQRICMYPMVILFGVALIRNDSAVIHSAAPLAGIGVCISLYQYITTQQLAFIQAIAFVIIIICCIYILILERKEVHIVNFSSHRRK